MADARQKSQRVGGLALAVAVVGIVVGCRPEPVPSARKDATEPLLIHDLKGNTHRPFDGDARNVVVALFVGTDCPISNSYAPELNRLMTEYRPRGVEFFVFYPDRDVTTEAARTHARDYGYACPAALDHRHEWVRRAGVTVTPEAAVWGRDGRLAYRGRIDDRYVDFGKKRVEPTTRDLRDAIETALRAKPGDARQPAKIIPAVGCAIPTYSASDQPAAADES